jgi:magnesium-transporting ATPase (P-type)
VISNPSNYPWSKNADEVLAELETNIDNGLTSSEIKHRQNTYGLNTLKIEKNWKSKKTS